MNTYFFILSESPSLSGFARLTIVLNMFVYIKTRLQAYEVSYRKQKRLIS